MIYAKYSVGFATNTFLASWCSFWA